MELEPERQVEEHEADGDGMHRSDGHLGQEDMREGAGRDKYIEDRRQDGPQCRSQKNKKKQKHHAFFALCQPSVLSLLSVVAFTVFLFCRIRTLIYRELWTKSNFAR